jgi:uncharacterized protein YndB with AHSA1/START domain
MDLTFKVSARIAKPVAEVFEAIADPSELSRYFTTGGAKGRLETGSTVTWDFHDFPGAFPVWVIEVVPERRIVLQWEAGDEPPSNANEANDGDDHLRAARRRAADAGLDLGGGLARDGGRSEIILWQLPGLDANALRAEGIQGIWHQPAGRHVQVGCLQGVCSSLSPETTGMKACFVFQTGKEAWAISSA